MDGWSKQRELDGRGYVECSPSEFFWGRRIIVECGRTQFRPISPARWTLARVTGYGSSVKDAHYEYACYVCRVEWLIRSVSADFQRGGFNKGSEARCSLCIVFGKGLRHGRGRQAFCCSARSRERKKPIRLQDWGIWQAWKRIWIATCDRRHAQFRNGEQSCHR